MKDMHEKRTEMLDSYTYKHADTCELANVSIYAFVCRALEKHAVIIADLMPGTPGGGSWLLVWISRCVRNFMVTSAGMYVYVFMRAHPSEVIRIPQITKSSLKLVHSLLHKCVYTRIQECFCLHVLHYGSESFFQKQLYDEKRRHAQTWCMQTYTFVHVCTHTCTMHTSAYDPRPGCH